MYVVVLGILSILLALTQPLYDWVRNPWLVAGCALVATALPPIAALVVRRRALRLLDAHLDDPGWGQFELSRGVAILQGLLALLHGALFLATDWLPLCARTPVVGRWPLAPSLLAMTPLLLCIVLVWVAIYPADRAVRQIAIELYVFRGKPVRPVWPLIGYLIYNLRHQVLFILAPMLLILLARDVVERYKFVIKARTGVPFAPDLLIGCAALLVALVAPVILRHVWVTQRLPDGPLRDRLAWLSRRLRVRCREILVWRSGGMIVNAAVMGVVPPLRYVLITDGMLEQMDDTKIEAVFGHEAGHVKRHHILFFMLFALISGCALTIFSVRARGLDPVAFQWTATVVGVALLLKWGLLFGWISRRFERQADIYGVRSLALAGLPCSGGCPVHVAPRPIDNPLAATAPLCTTAAQVFGNTLNEVAVLNGIPPEAGSWRHGSIASRSRLLQRLACDPAAARRFERTVAWIKGAILALAAAGCAWSAWEMKLGRLVNLPWLS